MWNKLTVTPFPADGKYWVRAVSQNFDGSERISYHSCEVHKGKPFVIGHHFAFDVGFVTHWAEIELIISE